MIDKIISYLKQGYQITNKKWEIIPIYFLYSMAVPVAMIILVTVFTVFSMLFIPILDDAQNDTSRIVIFGIIFFILLFLGILIFFILIVTFSAIVTGIRAALKEIMDKDAYPSFSLVNENIKKFFKRSFSFNMIITGYVFIVLLCVGLVLAVLIGISIFVAESFGDESPLFIIIIFLPIIFGVFGYFILIFSSIYFNLWKKTSDYYLIFFDCDWRTALKNGREMYHTNFKMIILYAISIFVVTFGVSYVIQVPLTILGMIPFIGFIFSMLGSLFIIAFTSYMTILDSFTFLLVFKDIDRGA